MDKLKNKEAEREGARKKSFFARLTQERVSFGEDLFFFILGVLFSRCHIIFGAYPLGVALLSLLPTSVVPALFGAGAGALTMGRGGIVFAAVYLVVILLRIIISSGKESFFGEALITRMAVAVIGGFSAAVCEIIVRGVEMTSVFFGLCMVLLSPLATFALSGLFGEKTNLRAVVSSTENLLSLKDAEEKDKFDIVFFDISALVALFLISLSLERLVFFGISISYVFSCAITLLVAKRFGAVRAMAVGFVSSFGIAGIHSVSFALSGLAAGAFFSLGAGYAIAVSFMAIAAWSYYMSGLSGLLATAPECLIAISLISPFLKSVKPPEKKEAPPEKDKTAQDMVGTVALSYQKKYSKSLDSLELSLSSLSSVISEYSSVKVRPTAEEYRPLIMQVAQEHCKNCTGRKFCMIENIRPCLVNIEKVSQKLAFGAKICPEDVNGETEFCQKAEAVAESINERAARFEEARFRIKDADATAEEYALISKLINEARCRDEAERAVNSSLTEPLTEALESAGIENGMIRAFGERRKHIILAGEDPEGEKISSQKLRREIEKAIGVKLGTPEYFKKDKMALMECGTERIFAVEYAKASAAGTADEISGDTVSLFESEDDCFYSLISDGMGSGEVARDTSLFVSKFLLRALNFGSSKETVLHMLNYIIRRRGEECSATVDLFELDLLNGEATFIKSGAAPSFIKRADSLFRIKSQTAPIGLMKTIDTERIKVEVREGDFVIMLSDGIAETMEDAPWLIELIANSNPKSPAELGTAILEESKRRPGAEDDMSVAVIKIKGA